MSVMLRTPHTVLAHPPLCSVSATFFAGRHWVAHGGSAGGVAVHHVQRVAGPQQQPPQHLALGELRLEFDDAPGRWQARSASEAEGGGDEREEEEKGAAGAAAVCTAWCDGCGRLAAGSGRRVFVFVPEVSGGSGPVTWVAAAMVTAAARIRALSWRPGGRQLVAAGGCVAVCSVPLAAPSQDRGEAGSLGGGAEGPAAPAHATPARLSLRPTWSTEAPAAHARCCAASADFFATAAPHTCIGYVWSVPADGSGGFCSQAIHHPRAVEALEWQPRSSASCNDGAWQLDRLLTLDAAGTARVWCQHAAARDGPGGPVFAATWSLPVQPHYFESQQLSLPSALGAGGARLLAARWVGQGEDGEDGEEAALDASEGDAGGGSGGQQLLAGVTADGAVVVWRTAGEETAQLVATWAAAAATPCGSGGGGGSSSLFFSAVGTRKGRALRALLLSASEPCFWSGEWCLGPGLGEASGGAHTAAPMLPAVRCATTAHSSAARALVFAPFAPDTGGVSLSGNGECALVWDIEGGALVAPSAVRSSAGSFSAVAIAADGALLACASTSGQLVLFAPPGACAAPSWSRVAAFDALDATRPWAPRALAVLGAHPEPRGASSEGASSQYHVLAVCPEGLHLQLWTVTCCATADAAAPAVSIGSDPFTYWCDEPIACVTAAPVPAWCLGEADALCWPSVVCSVDECGLPSLWDLDASSGSCSIAPRLQKQVLAVPQPCAIATAAHVGRFLVAAVGVADACFVVHVWEGESDPRGAVLGLSGRLVVNDEETAAAGVSDAAPQAARQPFLAWHAGGCRGAWPVLLLARGDRVWGYVEQPGATAAQGDAGRWSPVFAYAPLSSPCEALSAHAGAMVVATADGGLQTFDTVLSRAAGERGRRALGISAFVASVRQPRPAFDPRCFEVRFRRAWAAPRCAPSELLPAILTHSHNPPLPLPPLAAHARKAHVLLGQTDALHQALQQLSGCLKGAGDSDDVLRQLLADAPLLLQPLRRAADGLQSSSSSLAEEASAVASVLWRAQLPGISAAEQTALHATLDATSAVFGAPGLDPAAQRYCLHATMSVRELKQRSEAASASEQPQREAGWGQLPPQRGNESAPAQEMRAVSTSDVAWAQLSPNQDVILRMCMPEQPTWSIVRGLGVALWLRDGGALVQLCRRVANVEYTSNGKDPARCALWHVALGQVRVLGQLYSMNGEGKVAELLVRDFKDPRWQRAALKNAHALCSKHRYPLAAAFFILAGKLAEAVSLCAKKMEDGQLACVVARLVGGSACEELRWALAQAERHRWLGAISAKLLDGSQACMLAALAQQDVGGGAAADTAKLFGLSSSPCNDIDVGAYADAVAGGAAELGARVDTLHREAALHLGRDAMPLLALAELGRCRGSPQARSWADRGFWQLQALHAAGGDEQRKAQVAEALEMPDQPLLHLCQPRS